MTIADLHCDVCAAPLAGAAAIEGSRDRTGIRLFIHPGDPLLRDDQPLVCGRCFADLSAWMGEPERDGICAVCEEPVAYAASLHVLVMTGRLGEAPNWQFCRAHGAAFLNRFRFIDPKMAPDDLALKVDFPSR